MAGSVTNEQPLAICHRISSVISELMQTSHENKSSDSVGSPPPSQNQAFEEIWVSLLKANSPLHESQNNL